ncbi:hypothetical protein K8B33_01345 [Alcanivorax sp. JB21]|uniref:hypothetical protein n=1 Tax=Alcanivorax limicola TaxID=2874102 RepID=UPI001CBF48AA|nr:hypothetical protein [Alcanivorax limicola]MBZ2187730.1 hypothetical protein [Alcanivorax limicola]
MSNDHSSPQSMTRQSMLQQSIAQEQDGAPSLRRWLQAERPRPALKLCDIDRMRHLLQPCDVLLIDGATRLDARLRRVTDSRWSRAGLYLGRLHDIRDPSLRATATEYLACEPDTQLVLMADPARGLVLMPLAAMAPEHVRICRPRGLGGEDPQAVIRYALSRLGTHRPLSSSDALALLLPWGLLPRHWRTGLFARLAGRTLRALTGSTVGDAFSFIQFPILPLVKRTESDVSRLYRRHPQIFFPADFDHSPYFDIVKYPFVDHNDERKLRLLPWKGRVNALEEGIQEGKGKTALSTSEHDA